MNQRAAEARGDASLVLGGRLIGTLAERPFVLTAAQLRWVDGELRAGPADGPLARVAAGRYAGLFADHVIETAGRRAHASASSVPR